MKLVDHGAPPRGTPKNYLIAWLLVMLRRSHLHGYEIVKELRDEFGVVADPGTVYRTLRQLEAAYRHSLDGMRFGEKQIYIDLQANESV